MRIARYHFYSIIGFLIVLYISLAYGFEAFNEMIDHIVKDLTIELKIHAYIAGFVLMIYAASLYIKSRGELR